ncbi:hypothetical protein [Deinococcus radiophilus]|uniref:hypothetical protein n=1 Tax=Deinococcus radiophilus TaxID=32062 RepID=UPI003620C620
MGRDAGQLDSGRRLRLRVPLRWTAAHPLAGLSRRVIHMGTFSAFLFSGLRLGFLVVPPELIGSFSAVKQALDRGSSWRDSATLARFMAEGHFARHLGRTRRIYAARHDLLAAEVQALGGQLLSTGRGFI